MKKPVALILTDTHSKDSNVKMVENIFHQAFDICEKRGVKYIIHAGDWFQYRALKFESSLKCLLSVNRILQEASKRKIIIYTIQGNHDKPDLTAEEGYMSIVHNPGSLRLFEKEGIEIIEGIAFCFLPYFKEGLPYLSRLLNLVEMKKDFEEFKSVLITHTSIDGVINNDGTIVTDEADVSYFDEFNLVISGHYHNEQPITEDILYIGSAYQGNFGETPEKGFKILYDDLSLEHIQAVFPHYIKVFIDVDKVDYFQELENAMEFISDEDDDKLQIVLQGSEDKIATIDKKHPFLKGKDVRFEAKEKEIQFKELSEVDFDLFDSKSIAKNWMEYAKLNKISQDLKVKGLKKLTNIR